MKVLGYVLATWHANPDDAVHCQLMCINLLLVWFGTEVMVHHLILLP